MFKNIIFFDFNGVLDNGEHLNGHPMDIVRKTSDFDKLLRLFKFAVETNSLFVSISTYNHTTDTITLCYDTFLKKHNNELTEEELNKLDELYEASAFYSYTLSKDDIIFEVIYDYCKEHNVKKEDLNIVSFEDQEELTDLANQVWVNPSDGLTDENIASARGILKGKFNYAQALGRTKRHKTNK